MYTAEKLIKPPKKWPKRVSCPRPWELVAKINRVKAINLRFKGLTYRQIGQHLGRSKTTAHRYVWDELCRQD